MDQLCTSLKAQDSKPRTRIDQQAKWSAQPAWLQGIARQSLNQPTRHASRGCSETSQRQGPRKGDKHWKAGVLWPGG